MKNETTTIKIDGMSCGHCVASVRKALEGIEGITVNAVEIGSASITCDLDLVEQGAITEAVAEAIDDAGFTLQE